MKPIECPMCGREMVFINAVTLGPSQVPTWVNHQIFRCLKCTTEIHIPAFDERAARRAWDKSLIGRLRKAYKELGIPGGAFALSQISTALDIMYRMFGGSDKE